MPNDTCENCGAPTEKNAAGNYRENCGAPTEKNAAGNYREKCEDCLQAAAEHEPHFDSCDDPDCAVCRAP